MIEILIALSVGLMIFSAVEGTRFIIRFSRTTYRRTLGGRHVMGTTRVIAALVWGTLILAVVPFPLWAALSVQVALFAWLAFELNRRNRLFTASQRAGYVCPVCGVRTLPAEVPNACGVDERGRAFRHLVFDPQSARG